MRQTSGSRYDLKALVGLLAFVALGALIVLLLSSGARVWAMPGQSPFRQTVPVLITLNVTLQRPNAPPPHSSWAVPVHMALYPPGDPDTIYDEWDLTLDTSGNWSDYRGLELGEYDVRIKNMHTLRNVKPSVNITLTTTIDMGELLEGDANDDNRIRITDFGILRNAYFTNEGDPDFDPRADFDEDDRIRIRDFSLLRLNYFQTGDIEVASAGQATNQTLGAVDMSVEPLTTTVTVGDQFTMTVTVSAGIQEVDGVEFDLHFDPLFLQVVNEAGQPAEQIQPAGPLSEVLFNQVDSVAGCIRYAAGTFDTASGEFPLAILRFKALARTQATSLHYAYADVTAPGGQSVVGELRDGTVSIVGGVVKHYLPLILRGYHLCGTGWTTHK